MAVCLNAPNDCDSLKEKWPLQAQAFETFGPQMMALLGTVMKPLGGRALLEEVCHKGVDFRTL